MKQAFVEPFPFNLDEFVTVDEVGDEAEDHNPPSSGNTTFNLSEDDSTSPVISTPARNSSADASSESSKKLPIFGTEVEDQKVTDMMENEPINSVPVTEEKVATKQEDVADTTAVLQKPAHQTVIGEIVKEETLTPKQPESEEKAKECVSSTDSEEAPLIDEDTTNKGASDLHDLSQFDSSGLVLKDKPLQISEPQEPIQFNTEHQSEKSESALQETEIKELPSQDTLLTLDEVGGEDGDFADEADEEEILKRQAGENPEALLTVDEVGGDEAEVEEEQLKKALEGLVTLDEIVEEEDEDDAGSFNPEVSIFTLLNLCWFESISLKWYDFECLWSAIFVCFL